ncbi:MAG: cache domain-containing protein [Myxococcales bacterium]|nr:cache domain-containing protein [Myxococcales bacterium]MCB9648612.1 cache domain-containing protein [Deltaproteobacteria bacterium]
MGKIDGISARLVAANAFAAAGLSGMFALFAYQQIASLGADDAASLEREIRAQTQQATADLTGAAVSAIGHYRDLEDRGVLTRDEAQAQARAHLARIAYGEGGYFWAHTYDPANPGAVTMVAHPIAALVGKDISQNKYSSGAKQGEVALGYLVDELGHRVQGAEGRPLFQQMNHVVATKGEGHVAYDWPRKGAEAYLPKISHVRLVPGWNWVLGTGVYTDDVDRAVASMTSRVDERVSAALARLLGIMALVVASGILVAVFMGRWLRRRVNLVTERLRDIAEGDGDLTQRLDDSSSDSLGELAQWFNTFVSRIQTMLKGVAESSTPLNGSIQSLNHVSNNLAGTTDQIRTQSHEVMTSMADMRDRLSAVATAAKSAARGVSAVAAANEQLSSNARSVSGSVEGLSSNLNSIAAATEEMNLSLTEVSRRCAESAQASERSSHVAADASARMSTLFEAAKRIGTVVELIEDIADQTSLLALNATIEASSAGEAGRGFAVVANEVKALAKQTASATEVIAQQMSSMLQETDAAVSQIREVTEHAAEVNSLTSMIAAAVEQQSATTLGIAEHVQQSAGRAREISMAVDEMSAGIGELTAQAAQVSGNVDSIAKDVNTAANQAAQAASTVTRFDGALSQTATDATEVSSAASGMSSVASQLTDMVARFTV